MAGIDNEGKIRITSLLGGHSSTIDMSAGSTGTDLITLIGPVDTAEDGSAGYTDCLLEDENGTLNIGSPITAYGILNEPSETDYEEMYNYQKSIPAKYNEIIYVSDDYYAEGSTLVSAQEHGIIITYTEIGK